jgi:TetR/AcrR family transcriptional repressor of nem operon
MPWEKQFDKQEALKKAAMEFWAKGYEATSLNDLLDAMGIQKGSFYATYNSKHELLIDCLNWYVSSRFDCFDEMLSSESPKQTLIDHLNTVCNEASGAHQNVGCFLVNATLELAPADSQVRDLVQKALTRHSRIYQTILENAVDKKEISSSTNAEALSQTLMSLVMAMQIMGRASMPIKNIELIRDQAIGLLT